MPEVNIQHLDKIYDNKVQAVFDFNLDIKDGEFIVLVGPSGCGKSTTLRMVAGLEDITNGNLIIDGKDCTRMPPKDRDIAMVFQNYALYGHMTIYENMAFSLTLRKENKELIHRKVMAAAEILDLKSQLNKKPKQLSGGQRQRVAMGRAIVRNPKVFLFDEPLSNLDAKLRGSMRREILLLHKKLNATMIYVTHDQTEALTLADRIVCMSMGYVQQIGEPIELYEKPANTFVATFIGLPPMNMFEGRVEGGKFVCEYFEYPLNEKQKATLSNYCVEKLPAVEAELTEAKEKLEPLQAELKELEAKIAAEAESNPKKKDKKAQEALEELQAKVKFWSDKVERLERYKENLPKGIAEVILGVRPENIVRPGPVKLQVTNNENLGMNTLVHGRVGGTKNVVCKFAEWCDYKNDDEVDIGFDPEMTHFFEIPALNEQGKEMPGKAIR